MEGKKSMIDVVAKRKDTYDVKKKTMTLKETKNGYEAVDSPDEIGR
jgi:hypothetical protein